MATPLAGSETRQAPFSGNAVNSEDVVSRLARIDEPIGEIVRAYQARESDEGSAWVDGYFQAAAQRYRIYGGDPSAESVGLDPAIASEITTAAPVVAAAPVRLLTVHPHYFRGFLALSGSIDLSGSLVVLYGRNSAGKTGLAEALEWLFTGTLARRGQGDARELERCVGNQFRPDGESTWVEAKFRAGEDRDLVLKRILTEDFGTTQTSKCRSVLYRDGVMLSERDAADTLAWLFGGVAPLLMQHTLRSFVHSSPASRRDYFEQLLRLDDLTNMVEKAVVGDARLHEFPSDQHSIPLSRWEKATGVIDPSAARPFLREVERATPEALEAKLAEALGGVAAAAFPSLADARSLEATRRALTEEQQRTRQRSFSQLSSIRPKREVDASARSDLDVTALRGLFDTWEAAVQKLTEARLAAATIGEAQVAIAQAMSHLVEANLVDSEILVQTCPVCVMEPPSLTLDRISRIRSWEPVVQAVSRAEELVMAAAASLKARLAAIWKIHGGLLPTLPDARTWDAAVTAAVPAVGDAARAAYISLHTAHEDTYDLLDSLSKAGKELNSASLSEATFVNVRAARDRIEGGIDAIAHLGVQYRISFAKLESAVGTQAQDDPEYSRRERWLAAASDLERIASDLLWERAKRSAQKELAIIRGALMTLRGQLLESRRNKFSEGITLAWRTLREDADARFSSLRVPPPRGRGFPVHIEVKAEIHGPTGPQTVDALRVFSESQVHVLGIAAFVTRSKLVGHRVLIFDDPVQSMDEDHFRTFAGPFLKQLVEEGFQVIILTHNQAFEKCVSFEHFDSPGYVTFKMYHTRRKGCTVEEGNRRVPERLAVAERQLEGGDLVGAWGWIRQAIERLYTVVRIKHGAPGFDPMSWANLTADAMWNAGAGALISARAPDAGRNLKQILEMAIGGAHDAERAGETDLRRAIRYLKGLLTELRIAG